MNEFQGFPPPTPIGDRVTTVSTTATLQKKVLVSAIVAASLSGLESIAAFNQYDLLDRLSSGDVSPTSDLLDQSDSLMSAASGARFLAGLVFLILLLVWTNRTTKNLRSMGYVTEKSPGWSVWSYFVPLAQFWLVYGTLKDLIAGLGRFFPAVTAKRYRPIRIYWLLMTAAIIIGRWANTNGESSETVAQIKSVAGWQIVSTSLYCAAFIMVAVSFKRLMYDTK